MCVEIMDTKMKRELLRFGASCLRRSSTKPPTWRQRSLQNVHSDQEAFKPALRSKIVKATTRKYLRHQQRKHLARSHRPAENCDQMDQKPTENRQETRTKVADQPQGAMAPRNTTQYLMDLVYDDLTPPPNMPAAVSCDMRVFNHDESLLSRGGYVSLDYESSLLFQQRDFDDMFRHFGSH